MLNDRFKNLLEVLQHDFGPALANLAKKMYSHLPAEDRHSQVHRIALSLQDLEDNEPEKLKDIVVLRNIITNGSEPAPTYRSRLSK